MKCSCCSNVYDEFTYDQNCPICGFSENYEALTPSSKDSIMRSAEKYRQSNDYIDNILLHITDMNVKGIEAKYNNNTGKAEEVKKVLLFDKNVDGKQLYDGIIKSNTWISHLDSCELSLDYRFSGTEKHILKTFQTQPSEGLWYLGLHINKDLELEISICVSPISSTEGSKVINLGTVELDLIS